jgi:hypothetical protein
VPTRRGPWTLDLGPAEAEAVLKGTGSGDD